MSIVIPISHLPNEKLSGAVFLRPLERLVGDFSACLK
jgi:hypothetical protein